MTDYKKLVGILRGAEQYTTNDGGYPAGIVYRLSQAADVIEELQNPRWIPVTERLPKVYCANCKWFQCNMRQDGFLPDGVPEYECRHWCGPCDPMDYCSYAEPPKEETE